MVLKRSMRTSRTMTLFENDVKMYGTQATNFLISSHSLFENDVKIYGTQAHLMM